MGVILPLLMVALCCAIIWKSGDSFETASQFLGRKLTAGVRGATINAIGSSMPELLTSLIFLIEMKDAVGFSGGIGTTAGSAIYNSLVIPAVVGIIVFLKLSIKKITLSRKVILRDGFFLILIELALIFVLSGAFITWKDGLALVLIYFVYLFVMFYTMKKRFGSVTVSEAEEKAPEPPAEKPSRNAFVAFSLRRVIIGDKPLTTARAWFLIGVSTAIMAASCLLLVRACEYLGSDVYYLPLLGEMQGLNIPVMFSALILVAAASSLPDTILSVKDAQSGNYDDAFSNVLGSNIFDICFALGFPIFLYTLIYGPFMMPDYIAEITMELRVILILLTAIALIIFLVGKSFTRRKAVTLMAIYVIFIIYVTVRGINPELLSGHTF